MNNCAADKVQEIMEQQLPNEEIDYDALDEFRNFCRFGPPTVVHITLHHGDKPA